MQHVSTCAFHDVCQFSKRIENILIGTSEKPCRSRPAKRRAFDREFQLTKQYPVIKDGKDFRMTEGLKRGKTHHAEN